MRGIMFRMNEWQGDYEPDQVLAANDGFDRENLILSEGWHSDGFVLLKTRPRWDDPVAKELPPGSVASLISKAPPVCAARILDVFTSDELALYESDRDDSPAMWVTIIEIDRPEQRGARYAFLNRAKLDYILTQLPALPDSLRVSDPVDRHGYLPPAGGELIPPGPRSFGGVLTFEFEGDPVALIMPLVWTEKAVENALNLRKLGEQLKA